MSVARLPGLGPAKTGEPPGPSRRVCATKSLSRDSPVIVEPIVAGRRGPPNNTRPGSFSALIKRGDDEAPQDLPLTGAVEVVAFDTGPGRRLLGTPAEPR